MYANELASVPASVRAQLAACCIALDPAGFGGVLLRAPRADAVEQWLSALRTVLPESAPFTRVPWGIPDDRLLGGLDLAMTLALGRPVAERGLLARNDGGVLILPCAERAAASLVARLTETMDTGRAVPRTLGGGEPVATRFGLVVVDESEGDDEGIAAALTDRLAFYLVLEAPPPFGRAQEALLSRADVTRARALYPSVTITEDRLRSLVAVAAAFGVDSLRAVTFAVRAARGCAALHARRDVTDDDCAAAAALVLGPRATQMPDAAPADAQESPPAPQSGEDSSDTLSAEQLQSLEDLLVRAAQATLPVGLTINSTSRSAHVAGRGGKSGADRADGARGRQVGTRRGDPRAGGRIDLIETLRAAAPWQRLRTPLPSADSARVRIRVRADDFRLRRLHEPAGTTAIFVVDASGSSALNRMAEAKGAVELLLAEAYSRRDEVGLVSFRGTSADVLLAPTRAIAAAKRALAALPGGGGTPLASAIDRAGELVRQAQRTGNDTIVVFLSDARANIARDGTASRVDAERDAAASAAALRSLGATTLFIDTAPRPGAQAQAVAAAMGARYVALPRCDARGIHAAVSAALPARPV